MKKLLMLLLSVIMAFGATFGAVGCGGEELRSDISYFRIIAPNNGMGIRGIVELARRFQEANTDTSFAEGKTGVIVTVEEYPGVVKTNNIRTEGYHAYINPYAVDNSMIASGNFLNIDSIVKEVNPHDGKTIDSKIPEDYKARLKGNSAAHGEGYYFLPSVSYMGGLTYDKALFDEKGYYFTAPNQAEVEPFDSNIVGKEYNFAAIDAELYSEAITSDDDWNGWNSNLYLSCGPDGVYKTNDDGMPSSLEELVVLCERMKGDGIAPFVLSGKYPENHSYVGDGLINSLLKTEENMLAMKNFSASEFEIVTGYEANSELWGMSSVQVPKTAKVPVTESQGYYTTWSAAKYYNAAFWKLAVVKEWFSKSVTTDSSHVDAQADFIFSGYDTKRDRSAFMVDASYWFNESTERNNFEDFDKNHYAINSKEREKQIKWFPLPREVYGTVTEGNGTPEAFMYLGEGGGNLFNAAFKDDPEAMEIIRQWILFYYSNESQKYLINSTGMSTVMDLGEDFDPSVFNDRPFYKDLFTRESKGVAIKPLTASKVAESFPELFMHHGWASSWVNLNKTGERSIYTGFTVNNYSVKYVFEFTMIKDTAWGSIYQSSAADGMPPTHAKDEKGNDIVYAG